MPRKEIPPEVIQQIIDGQASTTPTIHPIGVPDGYIAPPPRMSTEDTIRAADAGVTWTGSIPVAPSFFEGDEVGFLFSLRPDAVAALQSQLTAAGLLDPEAYQPGFVGGASNDPTVSAIQVVMSYANRAGYRTVTDALRAYTSSGFGAVGAQGYGGGAGAKRLPAPVSNPDDLKGVFRAAVIDTLGTGWSDGQINAMVADYQAHERAYNSQVAAGESAPEVQLPSAETFAVTAAKAADPTGAQGQEFLEAGNALQSMLGRWSG